MKDRRGLWLVIAGQFLGAVADGALLIVAIQLLADRRAPAWNVPALRGIFYAAYVLMAPFAGAAADAWPKQRVLVATGLVKLCGCALLLAGLQPVVAYGLIGLGAVAHGPARYGILSELVPQEHLVAANAWLEGATVAAALVGVALASALVAPARGWLVGAESVAWNAAAVLACVYALAAASCAWVRSSPAADPHALAKPGRLLQRFGDSARRITRDRTARISLLATSTFWSAAAVLQFVVLRWAVERLGLQLSGAALLQGTFAIGAIAGAGGAGRWIATRHAMAVLPAGVLAGGGLLVFAFVHQPWPAAALLVATGALAGLLLVPMNTVLQLRAAEAHLVGQGIAVQHFLENLTSIGLVGAYGVLTVLDVPLPACVVALGVFVAGALAIAWSGRPARP